MEHETSRKNRSDQIFIKQSFISFKNSYKYFSSLFERRGRRLFLIAINLQFKCISSPINGIDKDGRTSSMANFLFLGHFQSFSRNSSRISVVGDRAIGIGLRLVRTTFVRILSPINQSDERREKNREERRENFFFIEQSAEKQVQQGIIRVLSISHTQMIEFYHSVLSDFFSFAYERFSLCWAMPSYCVIRNLKLFFPLKTMMRKRKKRKRKRR